MSDNQWADLGQRATACKGWRWMPGMKILVGLNDYDDYGALRVIGANKDGADDGYVFIPNADQRHKLGDCGE